MFDYRKLCKYLLIINISGLQQMAEDIFPKLLDTKSLMDCRFGELVMEECFGSVAKEAGTF